MNQDRRKKIQSGLALLENAKTILQNVLDGEQYAFDNMPENLQGSMRGMESEEAIDLISEAIEKLEESTEILDNI